MVTSDFGTLRLVEKLAEGGMSEVYVALGRRRSADPCVVAVKRLRHALVMDPGSVRLFMKEAWLGRSLRHPNLVRVLGGGRDTGRPFTIMEYLDGANLQALCRDRRFSVAEAVELAHAVARALAYLHAVPGREGRPLGVVHRALTPKNVFVTRGGEVKLLDLSAAKVPLVCEEMAIDPQPGSLRFMAPEQLAGGEVDHRADQFSLGAVLYELLTGKEGARCVSEGVLRALEVPRALVSFVMKLLSPGREQRFESTGQVVRALEALRSRREGRGEVAVGQSTTMPCLRMSFVR